MTNETALQALRDLFPRHFRALELRQEGKTLREVGVALGVGVERARQLCGIASTRLASPYEPRFYGDVPLLDKKTKKVNEVLKQTRTMSMRKYQGKPCH